VHDHVREAKPLDALVDSGLNGGRIADVALKGKDLVAGSSRDLGGCSLQNRKTSETKRERVTSFVIYRF
jgi:hypothetical protein